MRLSNLDEGSLAGAIRRVKAMKAEGMGKAEAHFNAKKMGIHAKVVDDIFDNDDSMNEDESKQVYTVYINGKKWKAFYKEETANKAAATIAAKGKKTEVKAGPAPEYKPREFKPVTPKPQDPKQKAAMDKALASIDATFGPEQRAISDQVLAMARTAKMLQDPKWADRAWSNVEPYGIKNVKDLKQELKIMRNNQKEVMDADTENLNKNPESNIKHIDRSLALLTTNEEVSESQVGMQKEQLENILLSMQYDINEKELLSAHKDQLIKQHNEIMEIYEQLESGEITEERLDEVLPLAALAWTGARAAAGAALRTAAGQALKRGAIQGAKRLGSKVRNAFKRGNRGKTARSAAMGANIGGNRNYGDLNLTNRSSSGGADVSGLGSADTAAVSKGYT